jgi:hypothetical protein
MHSPQQRHAHGRDAHATMMTRDTKRSGVSLVLVGVIGILFFWLTDPRRGWLPPGERAATMVDAIRQAAPGTVIGLAGSVLVLLIGLWLMTRRVT